MATLTLETGRKIEITDVQWASEPEECIVLAASDVNTGEDLTDDELDALVNDDSVAAVLYNLWYERQIERAEYMADMREDR